ncbi:hypothetical protein GAYE_SCF27MG4665 [Galdieria yellowstonensis]|uniref:Dienelactone hydrolase domain-containing protein n=1 Tax=Galdieria yellowstonensis TaxID=3028027 RepID=A0AAV9IHG3_9RHOD|nr:hypothetical protein GAYE_SCF27MG4665 [Galdieria yellowstonensis]
MNCGFIPLRFPLGSYRLPAFSRHSLVCPLKTRFRQIQMAAVTFKKQNTDVPGILYGENAPNNFGVIVVQEWWGLNEVIKKRAQELSDGLQCKALLPDFYRGKVATQPDEAHHMMTNLDWPGAIDDIAAACQYLKESKQCKKVGIVGYCMGGAIALAAAALHPAVDAAVCFYGTPPAQLCDVKNIKVPVQCHFGEQDKSQGFSDLATAKALEQKLKEGNVPHEFYYYPKAGHAFMNPPDGGFTDEMRSKVEMLRPYDEESRQLALSRMLEFFRKNLSS